MTLIMIFLLTKEEIKMEISINDHTCWVCGGKNNLTRHPVRPKTIQPKKNFIVPVCRHCHTKITSNDTVALSAFADLLRIEASKLNQKVESLKRLLGRGME